LEKIKAFGICLYKYHKNSIEVLLCKSVKSNRKWGFLKGVALKNEIGIQTARREFEEESNVKIEEKYFEKCFFQKNEFKDISIYLLNYQNVKNIDIYFNNNVLKKENLSCENSAVTFFNIKKLPSIKNKQKDIMVNIVEYLSTK